MAKRDSLFADGANYAGIELRALLADLQAGVFQSGDFKVTSSGSGVIGTALTSASGEALIQANQGGIFRPGKYLVADDAAEASGTWERFGGGTGIPTNATASPRLDAVVLQQYDGVGLGDGSGRRDWVRRYIPGAATPGIALGGALPALPSNCLLIAEVLVPASSPSTIPNANIRDRRPWARGAYRPIIRNANAAGTNDYTWTSAVFALLDSANFQPRLECSGNTMRLSLRGSLQVATAGQSIDLAPGIDGAADATRKRRFDGAAGSNNPIHVSWDITPAAGSHLLGVMVAVTGGATARLLAQAGWDAEMVVEGLGRTSADNS